MLRPATPLSILLFASFVLLLLSVISTPIVGGIPLARFQGVNFGVFGWCKDGGECSPVRIGWNTDDVLPAGEDSDFNLPPHTRHSLSSLLIVHPIAALFNLIALGLAVAAHLHSPSHSARYLLALLILLLPTLLLTLLAFLVDILLFVPYLQWGGWIVLASTILITASGVVTCAMRRTLVSRKARKKRIAENAEMSGANFYARQAEESKMVPHTSTESKSDMVNGAPGADRLPAFATYNSRRSEERPVNGPSPIDPVSASSPLDSRYYNGQRSRSNSRPRGDEFGAPLGAARSFEDRPPIPTPSRGGYGPSRGGYPPRGALSSRGSRGPAPSGYRGRGGYPPHGRGGYPQGPTPPGMMMAAGSNRRPPPGYGPQGPGGLPDGYGPPPAGPSNLYTRPGEPGYEPPSPSNYGSDANAGFGGLAYGARAQSPSQRRQSPYGSRAQSPSGAQPPQGLPPSMPPMPDQYGPMNYSRTTTGTTGTVGMDSDVLGMVEMQRVRPQVQSPPADQGYVPPRAGWNNDQHSASPASPIRRKRLNSGGGSDYVEDVDPRFAEPTLPNVGPSAPPPNAFENPHNQARAAIPSMLLPGQSHNPHDPSPESSTSHIRRAHSDDDLHPGARSPVDSEVSNFTSVSQRPANPNWQPGHGGEFNSFAPGTGRVHQQRRQDILFSGNPDFEVPGVGPPRNRVPLGGRGGYGRGTPMRSPGGMDALGALGADGRYPTPVQPGGPTGPNGGVMREI